MKVSAEQTAWDIVQDGLIGAMALLARTFDIATLVPEYAMAEWINQEVSQWRDRHQAEADSDNPEADSDKLSDSTSPAHSPSRLQNAKEKCSCCGRISIKVHGHNHGSKSFDLGAWQTGKSSTVAIESIPVALPFVRQLHNVNSACLASISQFDASLHSNVTGYSNQYVT